MVKQAASSDYQMQLNGTASQEGDWGISGSEVDTKQGWILKGFA